MKKLLVGAWVILLGFAANAQKEFEGKIVYEVKMEMPFLEQLMMTVMDTLPQAEKDAKLAEFRYSMDSLMKGTQEYYYKNGAYKSVLRFENVGMEVVQYFDAKKRLMYEYTPKENKATYFSVTEAEEGVADKAKVLPGNDRTILGVNCKAVEMKGKGYSYKAWYSPGKCPINPAQFKDHLYQGFNVYAAFAKAQPLRYSIESGLLNMHGTAIEVKEMTLSEDEFKVPSCKKTKTKPTNPYLEFAGMLGGDK